MQKSEIFYYSSQAKLVQEKIEKSGLLCFLYNNLLGKFLRKFLNKKYAAKIYAIYQNSFWSKRKILPFIKKHNINMSQFERKVSEYKSFNDFFTRKLKPGIRHIDLAPNVFISPADSKLFVVENISQNIEFFVKNERFNLSFFLQEQQLAQQYQDGLLMIFRLAPPDYHRFHFPVDCISSKLKIISGSYESVNPITYKSGIQPLLENERQLTILKTETFSDVIMVSVGAMFVGKIVQKYVPDEKYKKGEEMGYFEFGGSSLVLIFKKGTIIPKKIFLEHSKVGFETEIKMGQTIN